MKDRLSRWEAGVLGDKISNIATSEYSSWEIHVCVFNSLRLDDTYMSVKGVIISSGLLFIWQQTITWINAELSMGPLGTNLNVILIKMKEFSFKKMHLTISATILFTLQAVDFQLLCNSFFSSLIGQHWIGFVNHLWLRTFQWLRAKLQQLYCYYTGVTTVLC